MGLSVFVCRILNHFQLNEQAPVGALRWACHDCLHIVVGITTGCASAASHPAAFIASLIHPWHSNSNCFSPTPVPLLHWWPCTAALEWVYVTG